MHRIAAAMLLPLVLPLAAQEPGIPPTPDQVPEPKAEAEVAPEAAKVVEEFRHLAPELTAKGLKAFAVELLLHSDRLGAGRLRAVYLWQAPAGESLHFPEASAPRENQAPLKQALQGCWQDLACTPLAGLLEEGGRLELGPAEGETICLELRKGKKAAARLHFDGRTRLLLRQERGGVVQEYQFAQYQGRAVVAGRIVTGGPQGRQGLALGYEAFRLVNGFVLPTLVRLRFRGAEHELPLTWQTVNGQPALAAVGDGTAIKERIASFQAGWPKMNPLERIEAAKALAALGGPDAALALAGKLRDPSPEVRAELARSLGHLREPKAVPALIDALERERKEAGVCRAVCRALGEIGDPRAISPLARNLLSGDRRDEEWQTQAKERIDALGSIRHPEAVEELLDLMAKCGGGGRRLGGGGGGYGPYFQMIDRALSRLTGANQRGFLEWKSWWKEHKGSFRFPEESGRK